MTIAESAWNQLKHLLGVEDGKGGAKALLAGGRRAIPRLDHRHRPALRPVRRCSRRWPSATPSWRRNIQGYSRYSVPFGLGPASHARLLQKMPERGDVVVFRLPRDPSQTYIKRVIGLPGDRIQMKAGRLWINGKETALKPDGQGKVESEDGSITDSPRYIETLPNGVAHPIYKWTWSGPLDDTQQFTVPAGHLFMMGDNRDNSLDSRVAADSGGVGFVPVENLVGRAEFVVGSYDFLNAHAVWSWVGELRLSRFFNGVN